MINHALILISKYEGTDMKVDDFLIMREDDILGIIGQPEESAWQRLLCRYIVKQVRRIGSPRLTRQQSTTGPTPPGMRVLTVRFQFD